MSPRGCLLALLAFVAIVIGVLWVALPPVVGGLAAGALSTAGVQGTGTRVDVAANPPLRLLLLEADSVRVRSTDMNVRSIHADSVDVTLRGVNIPKQSFDAIEGTLTGVRFTPDQGPVFQATQVQVAGPRQAARVAITVDHASVKTLVQAALPATAGVTVSDVRLAAPDRVTVVTSRGNVAGRLQVTPAGDLVLVPPTGGPVPLLGTGPDQPVRLDSVQVVGDALELAGTANLTP